MVAVYAYFWITDNDRRELRAAEEEVVLASRVILSETTAIPSLDIVDPLATNRKVGKVYVDRSSTSWFVSGYYRRDKADRWHPYLLELDDGLLLVHLKVADAALRDRLTDSARFEVLD